ncbi:unnamed protein product, partial [marine sediment metagenome]
MQNNNFFKFKNLSRQKNLIHGIFNKTFGNVSLEWGSKKEVLENRKKIAQALGIKLTDLYEMEQVHGGKARVLRA